MKCFRASTSSLLSVRRSCARLGTEGGGRGDQRHEGEAARTVGGDEAVVEVERGQRLRQRQQERDPPSSRASLGRGRASERRRGVRAKAIRGGQQESAGRSGPSRFLCLREGGEWLGRRGARRGRTGLELFAQRVDLARGRRHPEDALRAQRCARQAAAARRGGEGGEGNGPVSLSSAATRARSTRGTSARCGSSGWPQILTRCACFRRDRAFRASGTHRVLTCSNPLPPFPPLPCARLSAAERA